MLEFLFFTAVCAVIAFLVVNIQKQVNQPKTKLQPIKIEREDKQRLAPRHKRPY